jgi:glycerate 2-kinase
MKIIIAPDKFKGSLSSFEVCDAIVEGLRNAPQQIEAMPFPMADGGDGFATVLKHYLITESISCNTLDPFGRSITAAYEWQEGTRTAIIEVAAASGLVLLSQQEKNTLKASTIGTGLLIKDAIARGALKIILGLGGSATTDAGTGILSALGFIFYDGQGNQLPPTGENLHLVRDILSPAQLPSIHFEIAVDVQNVLYGPQGAAFIYAPQKGADMNTVKMLDEGLENFSSMLFKKTGRDVSKFPGSGAAGGIAAGIQAFFQVSMRKGIEVVMNAAGLEESIQNADLLITGEGKIDDQSGYGKVVGSVCALARKYEIPCIAVCGVLAIDEKAIHAMGLRYAVAIRNDVNTDEEAMQQAARLVTEKMKELGRHSFLGKI